MLHELKIYPHFFQNIINDKKRFKIIKKDWHFEINDSITFYEFDPSLGTYTGSYCRCLITDIQHESLHDLIKEGYCILSIKCFDVKLNV